MFKTKIIMVLTVISVLLLGSCNKDNLSKKEIVFVLNNNEITLEDVVLRQNINALQTTIDTSFKISLQQIKNGIFYKEICKKYGFPITDNILKQECIRIDETTHNPEIITKIKEICIDSINYTNIYVLPDFALRWLNMNYSWNYNIHKQRGDSAKSILSELLKKDISLKDFAKEKSLFYNQYIISKDGISLKNNYEKKQLKKIKDLSANIDTVVQNIAKNQILKANKEIANQIINNILNNLVPSEIHLKPVEMEESFMLIQLENIESGYYFINSVIIPKNNFDNFLEEEIELINKKN